MSKYHDPSLYRSPWRAYLRALLVRIGFKGVVKSAVTQKIIVNPEVKKVRGAFLLVANHSSHLDAPMLAQGLPFAQGKYLSTGVAREYFFDIWYRRIFVRSLFNAFPIDRDGSRKHSGITRALLNAGIPVLVFPEGTRSKTGKMAEFKPGAASLAITENIPVIPAALIGAHEAMPKGRSWPKPGKLPVGAVFGAPMRAEEGESALSFNARIQEAVGTLKTQNYLAIMGTQPPEEQAS